MKKILVNAVLILFAVYASGCLYLYLFQEDLLFFPEKVNKDYKFNFDQNFEEVNIQCADGTLINGVLIKAKQSKGLIFYLHGNGGSIKSWARSASTYTTLNYDVFILDYRGYGKSEGKIDGEKPLFKDTQIAYNTIKTKYVEDKIIILGYSIGTGLAAKLASENKPKLLILQAPYYSLTDMLKKNYPILPTFILKYKLQTNEYLKNCTMPVVIFHGSADEVIYYGSSLKLKSEFKAGDTLITLNKQGHNGITDNEQYQSELEKILTR